MFNENASGELGLGTFSYIVHDERMKDLPLILETPTFEEPEIWAHEISLLNKVSAQDPDAPVDDLLQGLKDVIKKLQSSSRRAKKIPAKKRKKGTDTGYDKDSDSDS